jgi:hypothetical protein
VESNNERGFALIESMGALGFVVLLVVTGLGVAYFSFARVYLDRTVYEAAICLATTATKSSCESSLRKSVSSALPLGEIGQLNLNRAFAEVDAHLTWKVNSLELRINKSLQLPLLSQITSRRSKSNVD